MKLTTRQDIEAPVAFVFAALQDFDAWERAAMRRGADVARTDKLRDPVPGVSWLIKFAYRGKQRQLDLRLTNVEKPHLLGFSGTGASLDGQAGIDLMELGARRTRLSVTVELKPRSIGARLVLQSMRLAKTRLNRRFADRVAMFCSEIETRYRKLPRS